jgi:N-acetylglucosaminyl-diphospho-decaprenol L-rhamnosyltransferase
MDVSIIILNYKQKGLVKKCIQGIYGVNPQVTFEVIVVDNNSEDGCYEMIDKLFPEVKVIQSRQNNGMGAGNNIGIQVAQGKYVMIINPDTVFLEDAISKMFRFMESHADVGMVGPKLVNPDGTIQFSARRFHSWKTPLYRRTIFGRTKNAKQHIDRYLMKDLNRGVYSEVDWLFGACLFIRKSAIEKTGNFDERFFMYFEDCDLCKRFWDAGWKVVYFPEAHIVHYHHRQSAETFGMISIFKKASRNHIMSGIKYFAKYRGKKLSR